jgi:transposase InsO family protein
MVDRSSRPLHSPRLTRAGLVRRVVHLRVSRGWGPARIGPRLGMPVSTVGKVLRREQMPRLSDVDLATRQATRRAVVRYEHQHPGDLIHVDIKKLGRIPNGGGWRVHNRATGSANARNTTRRRKGNHPVIGYDYLHVALDDHSRLAYVEIHPDERATTAAGFWLRAHDWFAARGVTATAVLTDNGSCYRSHDFAVALARDTVKHRLTRPYRPQTNGKVERFNRTLLTEWAYARPYKSQSHRQSTLPTWLHIYNHHRHHTALGGQPPASRVPNLCGQYS